MKKHFLLIAIMLVLLTTSVLGVTATFVENVGYGQYLSGVFTNESGEYTILQTDGSYPGYYTRLTQYTIDDVSQGIILNDVTVSSPNAQPIFVNDKWYIITISGDNTPIQTINETNSSDLVTVADTYGKYSEMAYGSCTVYNEQAVCFMIEKDYSDYRIEYYNNDFSIDHFYTKDIDDFDGSIYPLGITQWGDNFLVSNNTANKLIVMSPTGANLGHIDVTSGVGNPSERGLSYDPVEEILYSVDVNNDNVVKRSLVAEPFIYSLQQLDDGYYSTQQCVYDTLNEKYQQCNNSIYFETYYGYKIYCDDINLTYCPTGCTTTTITDNETGIDYFQGECNANNLCSNECNFEGQTQCTSLTEKRRCGFYDSDPCLEWSTISCFDNQYCSLGSCFETNFTSYGQVVEPITFYLNVEGSTNTTTITQDSENVYHVSTTSFLHNQRFSVMTQEPSTDIYSAMDCNYQETHVVSDEEETLINDSLKTSFVSVEGHSLTTTSLFLDDDENLSIRYGNDVDDYTNILLLRNNTLKSLSICYGDIASGCTTEIITDTSINSFDDLEKVIVTLDLNKGIRQVNFNIDVVRTTGTTTYQTRPRDYDDEATNYNQFEISNIKNDSSLLKYNVTKIDDTPSFKRPVKGDYSEFVCSYNTEGCRTVRIYSQGVNMPLYNNYKDTRICVDNLEASSVVVEDSEGEQILNDIQSWSLWKQIVFAMVIYFVIAFMFFIYPNYEEVENKKMMSGLGIFLSVMATVLLIALQILDGWIMVLILITTGLFVMTIFRKILYGG